MESTLPSGLIVRDLRHRAFPRDVDPNSNDAVGSVGPNVDAGYGDTHVMWDECGIAPPMVQAWQGWPVEWATPTWGSAVGMTEIMRRASTVFAAISKQAQIISTMPPYRTKNDETISDLAWMRNPQPAVYTGWIEAMEQIVFSYLAEGEVFLYATSRFESSGRISSWVVLNPSLVDVELNGMVRSYRVNKQAVSSDDILHIRYSSWPGDARGHGPLEAGARSMFGAEALEKYAANLAIRGGIPWGTLETPRRLTADQARSMQSQYVAARASAMGAPAILSGGLQLKPLTINPKDMALLELRQFDESRLAVLLGVPPFLLALPSGADSLTYSTTESMYDFHWRSSLRPMAAKLMEAITNWTLPFSPEERLELNRDEYTRPSFSDRVTAWATLHGIVDDDGKRAIDVAGIQRAERLKSAPGSGVPADQVLAEVPG